jgi:hypothetical protein
MLQFYLEQKSNVQKKKTRRTSYSNNHCIVESHAPSTDFPLCLLGVSHSHRAREKLMNIFHWVGVREGNGGSGLEAQRASTYTHLLLSSRAYGDTEYI